MGIRRVLVLRDEEEANREEGIMVEKVRYGKGSIRVVGVYVNEDIEKK